MRTIYKNALIATGTVLLLALGFASSARAECPGSDALRDVAFVSGHAPGCTPGLRLTLLDDAYAGRRSQLSFSVSREEFLSREPLERRAFVPGGSGAKPLNEAGPQVRTGMVFQFVLTKPF